MMPDVLPPDRRQRLVTALEQLGAEDMASRAAAAIDVTAAVRSVGMSWDRVIIASAPAPRPHLPQAEPPAVADWRQEAMLCRRHSGYLKAWEIAFITEILSVAAPARKHLVVLAEIAAGLRARGLV
jgi:hypothetical protein